MKNVNKIYTFHQRIDLGWHPLLLQLSKTTGRTIKDLVEGALTKTYVLDEHGKLYEIENT